MRRAAGSYRCMAVLTERLPEENMNKKILIATLLLTAWSLPAQTVQAGEKPTVKPFARTVPALTGSPPEGFAIGRGATAYNGSLDGSIYRTDLRSGQGEVLVDVIEPWTQFTCRLLGMRVDPRTNYLFAAGCFYGNSRVYDADTGALIMEYQLDSSGGSVINDLAITKDGVYFTDFGQPFLYRLPLSRNGGLPAADAAVTIPLSGDFGAGVSNGIVATPDGKALIIGDSFRSKLFRVDPVTGDAKEIVVEPPLSGFLDGIAMRGKTLYIMTPYDAPPGPPVSIDRIQVVNLDTDYLTGTLVDTITDPDNLDGVASGAFFGNSLYVNNARYLTFPEADTEYWLTRLDIKGKRGQGE